jgi:hypothetical protein
MIKNYVSNTVFVKQSQLSDNPQERSEFLKNYFCEITATSNKLPDGWSILLTRPSQEDYYIDPDLLQGLAWWSEEYGNVDVGSIPFAIHKGTGFQLSLLDSWTIYSWSRWLKDNPNSSAQHNEITLLHVDDHDDMMVPRIIVTRDGWLNPILEAPFNIQDPESVEVAIKSGAIGIGSFIAPFVHHFPNLNIRHLCSTEYATERQGSNVVYPDWKIDDLLSPGSLRPALEVSLKYNKLKDKRGSLYQVTDDLSDWLKDIPEGPILVHIDMDYFNNRFNGDSDWIDNGPKYDPPLTAVLNRIDQVFKALKPLEIASKIVDFTIALSPGFFPSEMWPDSINRIKAHIHEMMSHKHIQ